MTGSVTPELQQNIITTIYLLFSHNYIAFAYFLGLILSIALAIYKPSRFTTFAFLGFAILLFSFEYDKHIISGLREQTIRSLITVTPHFRLSRMLDLVISDLLPVLFYVLGWAFIYLSIIYAARKMHKEK